MAVVDWLLDSDPAIRWQVLRDLTHAPEAEVAAERARVAREGWGARLLALRDDDGQWAGGACFPAPDRMPDDGAPAHGDGDWPPDPLVFGTTPQPWTSTLPVLDVLRAFGIDPADPEVQEAIAEVAVACRWEHAGQAFFDGEVEPCINGRVVGHGAYFGREVGAVVDRLVEEQLDDGGWNCWTEIGSTRASSATTINVLEGLLEHERATGGTPSSRAARLRGEEYLLERRLMRRLSTSEIVRQDWLQFSFPTRWQYDVLRALDHFRSAGGPPDPRLDEALDLVRAKRTADGVWLLENTHPGAVPFPLEDGDGLPSRWNTLRALRVLAWADGDAAQATAGSA